MHQFSGGAAEGSAPETLCIVQDAGRRWVAGCSEQERGWAPRYKFDRDLQNWRNSPRLMHEVAVLQLPPVVEI